MNAGNSIEMGEPPQAGSSQVFLRDTGLRFDPEGADVLHYDHATRLLLVVRRSSFTVHSVDWPEQPPQVLHLAGQTM